VLSLLSAVCGLEIFNPHRFDAGPKKAENRPALTMHTPTGNYITYMNNMIYEIMIHAEQQKQQADSKG
jgi:hypothetical protein